MTKFKFWNEVCKYGAIIGLVMSVAFVIEQSLMLSGWFSTMGLVWILAAVVYIALLYRFAKRRREQYGHEQHHADDDVIYPEIAGCYIAKQTWKERKQQSDKAAYFHHEHPRIFHHISWIQLYKGADDRLTEDFRRHQFFCLFFTHVRFASLRP